MSECCIGKTAHICEVGSGESGRVLPPALTYVGVNRKLLKTEGCEGAKRQMWADSPGEGKGATFNLRLKKS